MRIETLLLLGLTGLLASCTKDSAYDDLTKSGGIDLTMTVAKNGLTIPLGSVDKVYLSELIKTDQSDNIFVSDDSTYYIYKAGSMKDSKVSVDTVPFNYDPNIKPRVFRLKVNNELSPAVKQLMAVKKPGETLDELDQVPGLELVCKNIYLQDRAKLSNYTIESNDTDPGLLEIHRAMFSNQISTVFAITLTGLPNKESDYKIILHDVSVQLPEYVIAHNSITGHDYTKGLVDDMNTDGGIVLHKKAGKDSINWSSTKIIIEGGDFEEYPLRNINGHIYRSDTLIMNSRIEIPEVTLPGKELVVALDDDGNKIIQYKEQVEVNSNMDKMKGTLKSMVGRFYPDVDPISREVAIDVDKELDFLKNDDEVQMQVKNPTIALTLHNPCDIQLYADVTLDTHNGRPVVYKHVSVTPTDGSDSIVIKLTASENDPANNTYASEELRNFIQPLPDKIDVVLQAYADSTRTYPFDLGDDVTIGSSYKISVPFDFDRIKFVYDRASEDVLKDNDVTDYVTEVKNAVIKMNAYSTLPVEATMTVAGRNQEGIEEPGLIESSAVTIDRGSLDSISCTPVAIEVSIPDIGKVKDIVIRVTGEGENCELKSTQYLRFDSIQLTIPQLDIDLNDK